MGKKFLLICIMFLVVGCGTTEKDGDNENACCPNTKNCICSIEDNKKV